MNLVPRNQFFDIDSLFNDFFHGFSRPPVRSGDADSLAGMRVDVHENDKSYEIHADLPGVKKDDINVTLENGVLTVSASKNTEAEEKEHGKVVWRERSSGYLSRSFSVSPNVDEKSIKAHFDDGVLTLSVPKGDEKKTVEKAHRIAIK